MEGFCTKELLICLEYAVCHLRLWFSRYLVWELQSLFWFDTKIIYILGLALETEVLLYGGTRSLLKAKKIEQ